MLLSNSPVQFKYKKCSIIQYIHKDDIVEYVPSDVKLDVLNTLANTKTGNVGGNNYVFFFNDKEESLDMSPENLQRKMTDVISGFEDDSLSYEFRCYLPTSTTGCIGRCDKRVFIRNATEFELVAKFNYKVTYFNKEPDFR